MACDGNKDFNVLYTHQKTKKSKRWQDGLLRVSLLGTRAVLLDDKGSKLDTVYIKPNQVSVGEEIESDRYLITIEDEKIREGDGGSAFQNVPHQKQQQQHHQQQQQQQQQQSNLLQQQSLRRMPLKRKRTGFTVPRQVSKKLATENGESPSSTATHSSAPNCQAERPEPFDFSQKLSLFSTTCKSGTGGHNFRNDNLRVNNDIEKGLPHCSWSISGEASVNLDVLSSNTESKHGSLPSDLLFSNLQGNQSMITSVIDDTCTPPCYDADTPKTCPEIAHSPHHHLESSSINVDDALGKESTMLRMLDHQGSSTEDFKPDDRPRFLADCEQQKTRFPFSKNQSKEEHQTSILQEGSEHHTSNPTYLESNPAGRRNTSQILALLGKGKGRFKPPVRPPQPDSEMKDHDQESTPSLSCHDKLRLSLLDSSYPFNGPNSSRQDSPEDLDVMALLGQAAEGTTDATCPTRLSCEVSHAHTARMSANGRESLVDINSRTEIPQSQCQTPELEQCTNSAVAHRLGDLDAALNTIEEESPPSQHCMTSKLTSCLGPGRGFQNPAMTIAAQNVLSSGRSLCGDLFFPSSNEVQGVASLQRQVKIPAAFSSVAHYKQVFTVAIKEHLNIVLFELSQRYHSAKDKADIQYLDSAVSRSGERPGVSDLPQCEHGNPAKMVCVKKEGSNKGRFFYACSAPRTNQCKFFLWADQFKATSTSRTAKTSEPSRPALTDPTTATMYFKTHRVHLYYGCEFQRRSSGYDKFMPGAPAWVRKHKQQMLDNCKKKLYLRLSRKESSSVYGKDDIWVITKDLTFDTKSTFLARSVYHGPSSNNDVEIEPISGYSTSNWTSACTVHALHACNASSELTCLGNIQEYINSRTLPILQSLLNNRSNEAPSVVHSRLSSFKVPSQAQSNLRGLACPDLNIEQTATDMIEKYKLNPDQAAALHKVARMFQASQEDSNTKPITLIHGVFGAGKSFLLAITVLFLVRLFELNDAQNPDACHQLPWKLLIASTTNVAVDRILLGLLALGFEDFIRVGSIKKIAKPVLPYSVHASDSKDSQEIRDLYEMLKTDLTPTEKHHVRQSIDRQRLGKNRDLLASVRVVGVTCAACTFQCMSNLNFPVILLDECSQMTEPSSLLPIARFQCEKLVLVGDPKQLAPTIQGSEAAHDAGLEQTLFNRLIHLDYQPILLRTQYRCHPVISAISNTLFYNKRLIDGVTSEDRPPLAPSLPTLCFYSVFDGQECCANDGSFYNHQEAAFVISLIETLILLDVEPSNIGVITLYKAQTITITTLLQASKLSTQKSLKAVQISTVDAFQGGEKAVIILSCVRTDYMGFADSDKRTNVALTRSKNHLFIVGNLKILSANSLWGKVIHQCQNASDGIQSAKAFTKKWAPILEEKRQEKMKKGPVNQSKMKDRIHEEGIPVVMNKENDNGRGMFNPDSMSNEDISTSSNSHPPERSPLSSTNFSPMSEMGDSTNEGVVKPCDSSPSYSPLSTMEESDWDTSLQDVTVPCFNIGNLQDILE